MGGTKELKEKSMEMLKLKPACKDYLWGGHRLVEEYGIDYPGEICAEAWTLSCHKDGESVVCDETACESEGGANVSAERNDENPARSKIAGKTLSEVIRENGKRILGTNCEKFEDVPILIKLIDAKKPLSIQVHPDDVYALKNEGQYGKTEMWYILEAKEGAFLYQGFDHVISKEEFEERIKNNTLEEVLHKVYVNRGDVIFISPGTLHSIGEGIVIAEIQQNSNVTYRIYDYGRLGADGKPRQLHIKQSVDVTKLEPPAEYKAEGGHLANCPYFQVDVIEVKEGDFYELNVDSSSFVNLLAIEGSACVSAYNSGQKVNISKGESLFIPAGAGRVKIEGESRVILTRIP